MQGCLLLLLLPFLETGGWFSATPSMLLSKRESGSVLKFNADGGIGALEMLSIAAASSPVAAIFHVNNHMISYIFSRDAFPLYEYHGKINLAIVISNNMWF